MHDDGAEAVNRHGERFTRDNVTELLSVQNFMEKLRSNGVRPGG